MGLEVTVRRSIAGCIEFAALCLLPAPASAQVSPSTTLTPGVEQVVRAFAAAHDAADVAAMARLFDTSAAVTLVQDGQLRTGLRAVRAYLDSLAEAPRLYGARLEVRSVQVSPLGPEFAMAIVSVRDRLGSQQWAGVITLVLRRVGPGWTIIGLHKSGVPMAGE